MGYTESKYDVPQKKDECLINLVRDPQTTTFSYFYLCYLKRQ